MLKIVVHFEDTEPELLGTYVDSDAETGQITYAGTDGRWSTVAGDVGVVIPVGYADPNCMGCLEGEGRHAIDCRGFWAPNVTPAAQRLPSEYDHYQAKAIRGGDAIRQLHDNSQPVPGRHGWRVDADGREWYSAAWLTAPVSA